MGWKNGEETGDEVGWGGVHVGGVGGGGGRSQVTHHILIDKNY